MTTYINLRSPRAARGRRSRAGQDLYRRPLVGARRRHISPGEDGVRGPQADLPQDLRHLATRLRRRHENDGVADLFGQGREPRRGVRLLDREETPMEVPPGAHPEPPVADP